MYNPGHPSQTTGIESLILGLDCASHCGVSKAAYALRKFSFPSRPSPSGLFEQGVQCHAGTMMDLILGRLLWDVDRASSDFSEDCWKN